MKKVSLSNLVFIKTSSSRFDNEMSHAIVDQVKKKSGLIVAMLEDGSTIPFGELTEKKCSQMTCSNCEYHNKE